MAKPIDLVIGKIESLDCERQAGWDAYYKKDNECDKLKDEIVRLKAKIRRLRDGRKK